MAAMAIISFMKPKTFIYTPERTDCDKFCLDSLARLESFVRTEIV